MLFWRHGIGPLVVGLGGALHLTTGFGVVLGYHRRLTHRSLRAGPGLRIALALAGSFAVQGPPISRVAHHRRRHHRYADQRVAHHHRRHHRYADQPGDPHSPSTVAPAGPPEPTSRPMTHTVMMVDPALAAGTPR